MRKLLPILLLAACSTNDGAINDDKFQAELDSIELVKKADSAYFENVKTLVDAGMTRAEAEKKVRKIEVE